MCRFERRDDPETKLWAYPYQAMNRLVQGSAADQTKLAMVTLWEEGIVPLVQVHDELDLSLDEHDRPLQNRVKEIMEHCVELAVPCKVDLELGINWGDSM